MMFICHDCKAIFKNPRVEQELHHELDNNDAEEFGVCPSCGSEDYIECEFCEVCGSYVEFTSYYGDTEVCKECGKKIDDIITSHLDQMTQELKCRYDAEKVNVKEMFIGRMADAY